MTIMYEIIISTLAGTACGALAGGLAGWRQARRMTNPTTTPTDAPPSEDDWVQGVAREWATAHGRPEAETLIANKLRLGLSLREQRGFGGRSS
jgi:hypothetical protein